MMKFTVTTCFVFAAFALVAARAAETMKCDEAGMSKMETGVMGMKDTNKKDMAMKEMAMAKDNMAKKEDNDCMMHMRKAEGMM